MLDIAPSPSSQAAVRRRVQAGLGMFLAGTVALFAGVLAQMDGTAHGPAAALADRFPGWPTWFVPESPAGYTVASMMVCWGVWALGSGLRMARERAAAR